ncbi:MAG: GGDEF domain-containing phosphodiesterase [Psychrilyobacter sp.]|uniref:EAL domain-containing protein n=1 Tax=Psychrilyobacter sp. TaxID=2586924 RepID=UPI003C70F608
MQNEKFFIKLIKKWYHPKKINILYSISLILLLIFMALAIIYFAGGTQYVYTNLMYIPLVFAVSSFGYLGGLFFGCLAGYLTSFIPLSVATMEMQSTENWVYRLLFFVIVGTVNGFIIDTILKTLKEVEKLTFCNRITTISNRKCFDTFFTPKEYLHGKYLAVFEIENFNQILNEYGNFILEDFIKILSLNFKKVSQDKIKVFHFRDNSFGLLMDNYNPYSFEKKVKIIEQHIFIGNILIYPELSIGVAKFVDTHKSLLQNAEIARAYSRKNLFSYYYFNDNINNLHNKKLSILNELPTAIENNQFYLYFHPKVAVKTGLISNAEVLIRWIHPTKGVISPDLFMPYMEKTNLINTFTNWLIQTSLETQEEWESNGFHIKLALNTPITCLKNKSVINTIQNYNRSLKNLEFEILERNLIEDFKEINSIMKCLKKYGINFALDDFGTSFSSISYLRNLPFDKLKIDKMFIKNMTTDQRDYNIVKSSIDLGKSLGLKIIAEGVEDLDTLNLLKELNCDSAQGYFFTKPLESKKFKEFCIKHNNRVKHLNE